jgi:23S rRNA pseudouridine955/2504/2580 synthase
VQPQSTVAQPNAATKDHRSPSTAPPIESSKRRPLGYAPPVTSLPPVRVVFEDDWLLVVDKPAGLATHGGAGLSISLTDWIGAHLGPRAVRNGFTASPAHRLDRETSGLLAIARRRPAMVRLMEAFAKGGVRKRYLALVRGTPPSPGLADAPLEDPDRPGRARAAVTRWRRLASSPAATLLECAPESGRKHQIRRHLADAGHPLAGDRSYCDADFNARAASEWGLERLFLHAARLVVTHPRDGSTLDLASPLPTELAAVLTRAGLPPP